MANVDSVTVPLHKPKLREKLFFLLSGMVVSIPLTLFISVFSDYLVFSIPPEYTAVVSIAVVAPFIEEFSKAYPLLYRHAETERSIFTLGFLVGLGFGIAEFIEYVVLFQEPVIVRLPGIFFHASTTSIIAFGIGRKRPFPFYLLAVTLHLSNNLLTFMGPLWYYIGPIVVGVTYSLSWYFHGITRERMIPI